MRIQIGVTGKRTAINRRKTRSLARTIFAASGFPKETGLAAGELSLVFSDDPFIAELNRRFLGRKGPTNVMAFGLSGEGEDFLAEIVISVETAAREARRAGISREERLTQLLIHGILHLAGYDHENRRDARVMQKKEREIFRTVTCSRAEAREIPPVSSKLKAQSSKQVQSSKNQI